jgi:hypothetical protein
MLLATKKRLLDKKFQVKGQRNLRTGEALVKTTSQSNGRGLEDVAATREMGHVSVVGLGIAGASIESQPEAKLRVVRDYVVLGSAPVERLVLLRGYPAEGADVLQDVDYTESSETGDFYFKGSLCTSMR